MKDHHCVGDVGVHRHYLRQPGKTRDDFAVILGRDIDGEWARMFVNRDQAATIVNGLQVFLDGTEVPA